MGGPIVRPVRTPSGDSSRAASIEEAGRPRLPRIATGRYFGLGDNADAIADEYIRHYYGDEFFPIARADTLTTSEHLGVELRALQAAGATDVILYPTSGGLEQVGLLAEALQNTGFLRHTITNEKRTDATA